MSLLRRKGRPKNEKNASAHGNCLINNINKIMAESKQPDIEIVNFIKGLNAVSNSVRRNHLRRSFVYNIATLLYVYRKLVPLDKQKSRFNQLKLLLNNNLTTNKDYFGSNSGISSVYTFFNTIVDKLAE